MSSLEFRPPQFSEDVAWLPSWLQHQQVGPFDELIKAPQTFSEQAFKDLISREGGRYGNCHLFLSGEDNSPVSFSPSCGHMLHLHLHLSSDGYSLNLPNPLVDTSQAERLESNNVLSMQQAETLALPGERVNQSKRDCDPVAVDLFPLYSNPKISGNVGPQSVTNNTVTNICNNGTRYKENSVRKLRCACIDDAVELSVAASEALVIHELVKSRSSSEALPAAAVLEISLRLKQARLEGFEDASLSSTEENDEIDFLLDLDRSAMADAFEDVGFSEIGSDDQCVCDSIISQAKESLASGAHYKCDDALKHVEHRAQVVDFDDTSKQKLLENDSDMGGRLTKDFPLKSLNSERQKKLSNDLDFGFDSSSTARPIDSTLHPSIQENPHVVAMAQRVDFAMVDLNSFHPQAWNLENAEESKLTYLVPDRFKSRWLGGWTGKEVGDSAQMKLSNKGFPKAFVGETSFLSESADAAPDENSCVQNHEKRSRMTSQSGMPFEGLDDKLNEGILLSQDVVRSSSLSLVDPLCSVVPCSISSENACSMREQPLHKNDREVAADKCFSPTSDFRIENLQRTSGSIFELAHGKGKAAPMINGDGSRAAACRHVTSLKTYSRLLPNHNTCLERGTVYGSFLVECNLNEHSFEQNLDCIRPSGERDSNEVLPKGFTSKCAVGGDYKNNHGDKLQILPPEDGSLPLILNRRMRHHLQASKHLVNSSTGEENPKYGSPETLVKPQHGKKLQMPQGKLKNPLGTQVPTRKRVRFSETEVQLKQNRQLQKLQPVNKNCSTSRAFKRLKNFCPHSDSITQEVERCLTNCRVKDANMVVLHGIQFLLTGFSSQIEKQIEELIGTYGGIVLSVVPSPPRNLRGKRSSRSKFQPLPVVLCLRKLQTTKFLYGCAVNACILKVNWLMDSVMAGSVLPPHKYMILSNQTDGKCNSIGKPICCYKRKYIFEGVGILFHGKHSFCSNMAKIFKHGGGQIFKTLQLLVQSLDHEKISMGAIVAEDGSKASRHLRHCASEWKIPVMAASWIINSLHSGKLLPFMKNN